MLKVDAYPLGPLQTNAYVLSKESSGRAVVIDPGTADESLMDGLAAYKVEAILLTHAHFDHIGGVQAIRERHQAPVWLHRAEWPWLGNPEWNGSAMWPDLGGPVTLPPADEEWSDGQELALLDEAFRVYHTPGHSPGSVSLQCGEVLFGGDVLFRQGVGRTDLYGGSSKQLYHSIYEVLFKLPPDTVVYPGHGPATTIGYEQAHNPYL